MEKVKNFLKKKDIEISVKRYFIDALGAMAQGLFASLLIGWNLGSFGRSDTPFQANRHTCHRQQQRNQFANIIPL